MTSIPTTAELHSAWERAKPLRFLGWTYERAMATPLVRFALEKSAVAHRRPDQPIQGALL